MLNSCFPGNLWSRGEMNRNGLHRGQQHLQSIHNGKDGQPPRRFAHRRCRGLELTSTTVPSGCGLDYWGRWRKYLPCTTNTSRGFNSNSELKWNIWKQLRVSVHLMRMSHFGAARRTDKSFEWIHIHSLPRTVPQWQTCVHCSQHLQATHRESFRVWSQRSARLSRSILEREWDSFSYLSG